MAKQCVSCGRKVTFLMDQFSMVHTGKIFCADCRDEARDMLEPIKILVVRDRLPEMKAEFQKKLTSSSYNEEVRKLIQMEFDQIAGESVNYSSYQMKRFAAGFQESYDAIKATGLYMTGETGQSSPPVIEAGEAKVATFVFEQYFFRNGSYASLTVTLVNYHGVSTVTAVGSGGGDGMLGLSWGAEEDFVKDFWNAFRTNYPDFTLTDVDMTENYFFQEDTPETPSEAAVETVDAAPEPVCEIGSEAGIGTGTGTERIGILGGSFDPIHSGHVALGKAAIREAGLEKLIVMPTHVSPFKIGRDYADDHHRLEMCRLAFKDTPQAEICDYEIVNTDISYTYDTLRYLETLFPDHKLYFITGTDSFLDIEYWHKGTQLLENFNFIVSQRPGYRESELEDRIRYYKERYQTEIIRLKDDMPDISSTKIKARRQRDDEIREMVPVDVERYIHEHKLYL